MFVKEMPTLAILVQLDIDAVETDLDVVVTYRMGGTAHAGLEDTGLRSLMHVGCLAVASHLVMWLICCLVSAQHCSLSWPTPSTTSSLCLPPTPAYCNLCGQPCTGTEKL